ncbi:MAG: hypothetical protein QM773_18970 [Hyphomonadaceae bacterium]
MNPDAVSVSLNLLALLGTGAYLLGQMGWREPTPLSIRLAVFLSLVMALFSVRAVQWWVHFPWLVRMEEGLAAFIPLFALFLAEGMLRRHAPAWMKIALVIGAIVVATIAVFRPREMQAEFAVVLGSFIVIGLLMIAILLLTRRRRSLSPGENDAISTFFAGLLLSLPVGATDFLAAAGVTKVQASGLALLIFVTFASRVTAHGGGGLSAFWEILWIVAGTVLAYVVLGFVGGWPEGAAIIQTLSILFGVLLAFRIIQYARDQRRRSDRQLLWRAFAEAPIESLEAFLNVITSVPAFRRAKVLEGPAVAEYDHDGLRAAFAADLVISTQDTRRKSAAEFQQLDVIFDQHEATHAVLVRANPLALLLVNMPRVGAGVDVEVQLGVLARLASRVEHSHA